MQCASSTTNLATCPSLYKRFRICVTFVLCLNFSGVMYQRLGLEFEDIKICQSSVPVSEVDSNASMRFLCKLSTWSFMSARRGEMTTVTPWVFPEVQTAGSW